MSYHHPEQVQTFQYPQNNYYPQNVGHGYNTPNQMYTRPNKKHQCNFCVYASDRKPDVRRHVEKKHPGMGVKRNIFRQFGQKDEGGVR